MPLQVPWLLGEGPVWRLGKAVLVPWVCGSGLQLPSTSGELLGRASFIPLYPTYLLVTAEDEGHPLGHSA